MKSTTCFLNSNVYPLSLTFTLFFFSNLLWAEDPYKDFYEALKLDYKVEVRIVDHIEAKVSAMKALLKVGDEKAFQTASLLYKDEHERVRELTYREMRETLQKKKELQDWVVQKMSKDKEMEISGYAMRLVRDLALKEALPEVRKHVKGGRDFLKKEALLTLKDLGSPEDASLAQKAFSDREPNIRAAAIFAMIYLNVEETLKDYEEKILKDSDFQPLNTYIRRLEDKKEADAVRVAKLLIDHKDWHVKAQCIDTLSYYPDKEVVDLLIQRLEKEEYRIAEDLSDALYRITDKDIGTNFKAWQGWWKANREKATLIKRSRKTSVKDKLKAAKKAKKESQIVYHGIPITSDRLAFLIDTSDSQKEAFGEKTRLDAVKAEMVRILKILKPQYQFNIIKFNTSVSAFSKNPLPASTGNIEKAAAWVQKFVPEKRTNVYDAITEALHPEIDTLILLSDGSPTDGVYIQKTDILEAINEWNEVHHVNINAVFIGESKGGSALVEDIATLTNALSVTIKK
jgi:HEAT repeat protein